MREYVPLLTTSHLLFQDLIRQLLVRDPIARLGNLRGGTGTPPRQMLLTSLR